MHRAHCARLILTCCSLASGVAPLTAQDLVIRPSNPGIDASHFMNGTMHFQTFMRHSGEDTTETAMPGTSQEEHVVQGDNLLLIKTSTANGRTYLDSMLFRRSGLVPVWERMYTGSTRTELTYSGTRVHSTMTRGDSVLRSADSAFTTPVFGFNQMEILVQSLPLAQGYRAILPLFSEGSMQLEMDSVSVASQTASADAPAWTVRFADPAIVITFAINQRTRAIESYEVLSRGTGARYRRVAMH
jgi:hypothetical protein